MGSLVANDRCITIQAISERLARYKSPYGADGETRAAAHKFPYTEVNETFCM